MEEENRKGPGVFYAVVGVATLVVAIIGATFAYFSASATPNTTTIRGGTNDEVGGALSLNVSRLALNPSPAPASDSLVPADFGTTVSPSTITDTEVNRALTAKCVKDGYTGCHVWKVVATTNQNVASANVNLHLDLAGVTGNKTNWSYVVYTGTDSAASSLVYKDTIPVSFPNADSVVDMHKGAALNTGEGATYYVMVYLNNVDAAQNDAAATQESGTTNDLGTYTGSVTLTAMGGGQVKASFAG